MAIFFLALTHFKLLYQDWRGYIIGGFAPVWIANQYVSIYAILRQDLKRERFVAKAIEHKVKGGNRTASRDPQTRSLNAATALRTA